MEIEVNLLPVNFSSICWIDENISQHFAPPWVDR